MGLVATWLNGIGLGSVVPTFEAAGIVSPSHLADLDVTYFESLGVTDPDDRRKLFYLVQRIKMAVNKKEKADGISTTISVEERVDAVVSKHFVSEDEENDDDVHEEEEKTESSEKDTFREEKKVEVQPLRRSKRIRKKQAEEEKSYDSKERKKKGKEIPDGESSTSTRKKKSSTAKNGKKKKKEEEVPSPPQSPSDRSQSKKLSSKLTKDKKNGKKEKKKKVPSGKSKIPSDLPPSNTLDETDSIDKVNGATGVKKITQETAQTSSSTIEFSNKGDDDASSRQHLESRLPGPSRLARKLEKNSTQRIASEDISTIDTSSALSNDKIKETYIGKSQILKPKSKRRVTLAANISSLEQTYSSSTDQSTNLDNETETTLDQMGGIQRTGTGLSRSSSRSSKSMGVSDSALLQHYQSSQQKRLSMSSSARSLRLPSPKATAKSTLSSKADRTTETRSRSGSTSSTPQVITQVASGGAESWATKIAHFREDNDAEHELFCDQEGDENLYNEYYDMRIKVIVRKRPLSKAESLTGGIDIIHPLDYGSYGKTLVYHPKTRVDLTKEVETVPFAFDNVFDESSTNVGIYERSLRNLVEPFFNGQWATVFAYGQTGSGKTYTMMGSNITGVNAGTATNDQENLGLYYLAALDIFEMIELPEYQHLSVHVSLFEIYGGKLFDLLNDRKQIKCLEDSKGKVCFPGLTEHSVHAPEHVMQLIEEGAKNRSTGTTSRNADSSRSHAVLQIKLMKRSGRGKNIEHGRFSFIDLAGSERGADTNNSSRATRLEGAEINTSLLALKEVIRALATGGSMTHIPFRGSKLTQVLKDSFVGENSRCCMVACISPDIGNCEQTLNTLRYADRVKERNPETGTLSSSCREPTKISITQSFKLPIKQTNSPSKRKSIMNNGYDTEEYSDEVDDFLDDLSSDEYDDSEAMLPNSSSNNFARMGEITEKREAGMELVANHRAVMLQWHAMVKNEMRLVTETYDDRESIDEYILELENIRREQIGFIAELRSSLQNYVSAAEAPHQSFDAGHYDDDSFEDLRD
mmetsp:Transcript_3557/g.8564  ORF Transcript_3557/g.8564 Transcript_3557/m.8564 type:complete len:1038 (+) Transcript_3557:119-3232(+)